MAAEQQLERSVLERKEREELRSIAQAMDLETNARTKKADIIDKILQAAGVASAMPGNGSHEKLPSGNGASKAHGTTSTIASVEPASDAGSFGEPAGESAADAGSPSALPGEPAGQVSVEQSVEPAPELAGESSPAPSREPAGESAAALSAGATDGAVAVVVEQDGSDSRAKGAQASRTQGGQSHGSQNPRQGQGQGQRQGSVNANEPGNRRNRRRRGRDRERSEREPQSAVPEGQYQGELVEVKGLFDQRDEGYGFIRADSYLPSPRDVYVSISQARRFALRKGDYVEGASRPAASNEKFPALIRIDSISGLSPDEARSRPRFEDLTPLFPDSKLRLEIPGAADSVTSRIIDLLSPIGKGQRGLIVSPPKAGKTTVMKQIAHSIEANNPEVHLMVLLVDERPEEVTDMRRSVKGEVVASTFDRPSEEHTQVAELAIDRAKRMVELGRDVVIILDGITRLARAYNLAQPTSGRIMSGGVDSGALYPPKKFFGAARNIEEGGSLTILATALVETGSKMDEVIFEEFKGTGNMELRLDRRLAERRLYPSIDVNASSTRHEELLYERGQLQQVWKLRRVLNALAADGNAAAGLELLMDKIRQTASNDEFLAEIAKGPAPPV